MFPQEMQFITCSRGDNAVLSKINTQCMIVFIDLIITVRVRTFSEMNRSAGIWAIVLNVVACLTRPRCLSTFILCFIISWDRGTITYWLTLPFVKNINAVLLKILFHVCALIRLILYSFKKLHLSIQISSYFRCGTADNKLSLISMFPMTPGNSSGTSISNTSFGLRFPFKVEFIISVWMFILVLSFL